MFLTTFVALPLVYRKWRQAEDRIDEVSQYAISKDREIERYKNDLGKEVVKTEALQLDKKGLQELKEDFKYLSEEFQGVKKNLKNVEQITRLQTSAKDTLVVPLQETIINNVPSRVFEYEDEWTRISGFIVGDMATVSYDVEVPIDLVVTSERKRILGLRIGKRKISAQATSKNDAVTITGLENITIH